jgi:hypothetical protein
MHQKTPFVCRDVRADGSCFFRALHGAAYKQAVLRELCNALRIDNSSDVNLFIKNARRQLARSIAEDKDTRAVSRIYATFASIDKESYAAIIRTSFPSWFARHLKLLPASETRFREVLAKAIRVRTNWVSQIEVEIVTRWAKRCGLELVILNQEPTDPLVARKTTLYLLNVDEQHYKYMVSVERKETRRR